ncbi:hypothetical protein V3C99_007729 [Haemonchus contortus]|uniref:Amino acid permease domain containing protein n=1 Tax=Haemonchus contortus TaxID=6289 RepID=A0A7I4YPT1_HAECO
MTRKEVNQLGVLGATSYIIGSVIGSGIFVSPKGILQYTGSVGLALIIWVASAFLAALNAINYVELGTSIPESGAEFAYVSYVEWYPVAFSFLWLTSIIESSCSGAALALTFGQYIMEAVTPIACLDDEKRKTAELLLAYGLLLSTSLLNMFSLSRFAGRIQFVSMAAKIAALIMIISIGLFYMIFKGDTQHFSKDYIFKGSDWTIPVAVLGGLLVSALIYVLANVAYFAVLTPQQILDSSAVATTFAQHTIGSFSYAMPALIGFLMLGSVNAEIFAWSRYLLAGSRRGMMPSLWSLIHPDNDSPRPAVFTHTILCMIFCLIGNVYTLVNYLTVVALLSTMFSLAALILIKWRNIPVSANAVKFHIFWPILNLLVIIALLVIPVIVEPVQSAIGFGLFLLGVGSYYVFVRPKNKPQLLLKLDAYITRICQLATWTLVDTAPLYTKVVKEVNESCAEEDRPKQTISTISQQFPNLSIETEENDTMRNRFPATRL